MRKIAILPVAHVLELTRRLHEVDIDASETPEGFGGPFEGPDATAPLENSSVWVVDRDFERASQIAAEFLEELKARFTRTHCRKCGYDLKGHRMQGKCPECGSAFELPRAIEEMKCPRCGEEVPSNFEVCWNCGAEIASV